MSVLISYLKELPMECSVHTCQVDVRCCKNTEHVCCIDKLLNAIQKSDIYQSLLPLISKDDSTGEPRGFCILSVDKTTKPLIFFKLNPNSINVNEVPCKGMLKFLDSWKSWLSTTTNTDDPNKLLEET